MVGPPFFLVSFSDVIYISGVICISLIIRHGKGVFVVMLDTLKTRLVQIGPPVLLTFVIPVAEQLVKAGSPEPLRTLLIVSCIALASLFWLIKKETASLMPQARAYQLLTILATLTVVGLLPLLIRNEPVAAITGRARTLVEILDVVIVVPVAEELLFRGVLWSHFERCVTKRKYAVLAVTSLLFGAEHLGYWAQTEWPLSFEAFEHALSMVGAGVCFGMLRLRSDALAVPIAIHMVANSAVLLTQ